jgi:ABC-type nitrate/sulfonate/bicarbonate transport system ATPase subunit
VAADSASPRKALDLKLQLRGITVSFRRDRENVDVLRDVNLDVERGEFLCIVGPSGCGKTTLLNVIAGFVRPSAGHVCIDGQEVQGPDARRIFVFQERGLFPWLTVQGNIGFGLGKLPKAERSQRMAYYIKTVGLEGFERAYPHELSGGMKQRVEVARALAVKPDVLYLDEPFGSLDSITRLMMRRELLRLWQAERRTILFVTHDLDEAVQLADRVVVMSACPADIQRVIKIHVPRPRDISSRPYLHYRDLIFEEIGLAHKV